MRVPFFRPSIDPEDIEAVTSCLQSGWLTSGPQVAAFEKAFTEYTSVPNAVALSSCTAALHLALEALGVERGEGVIVPTLTFAATAEVVRYVGAVPIFVDSAPDSLCMDPRAVERVLEHPADATGQEEFNGRIRAMIPVHYGGALADMRSLRDLANKHELAIVEDAAHALPAFRKDDNKLTRVGELADVTCFSFYANKCITTGEGGMATTHDESLAARMRLMALHGLSADAWHRYDGKSLGRYAIVAPGFKYNMPDTAAALGRSQLGKANRFWEQRLVIARSYQSQLENIPGLTLPFFDEGSAWHLYSSRIKPEQWRCSRDDVAEYLLERGIGTSLHWTPLHEHPYYVELLGHAPQDFPVAYQVGQYAISLPIFAGMTESEIDSVTQVMHDAWRKWGR